MAQIGLIRLGVQVQNFAVLAFGGDFKGAAADFAIGGETLRGDAGVHGDFAGLAAEGAGDGFSEFHR